MGVFDRGAFEVRGYEKLDATQREALAEGLCAAASSGQDLKPRWRLGPGDVTPGHRGAVLQCMAGDRMALSVGRNRALVDLSLLGVDEVRRMMEVMREHGLEVPEPRAEDHAAAMVKVVLPALLFLILVIAVVYPSVADRSATLANWMAVLAGLTVAGAALLVRNAGRASPNARGQSLLGLLLFMPGFVLLSPSSLLMLPALVVRQRLGFLRRFLQQQAA